jgi:autotransporter-associated beta strand protein
MNSKPRSCACRYFVLIAISLLLPVSLPAGAPDGEPNPFERSTIDDHWGILGRGIFFGGASALSDVSAGSRTPRRPTTFNSQTTSETNAAVNAASSEDSFSFISFFGVTPAVPRGGRTVLAPNATGATIEWANVGSTWATGANWVGGTAPADNLTSNIAAFGSQGATPVNPNLTLQRSVAGVSFLAGAYSYNFSGSILIIGADGISHSATTTETFSNGLRTSAGQTWTTNAGGTLVLNGGVNIVSTGTTNRTLTIDGAGNTTFNGVLTNSAAGSTGNLNKVGTGTLTLSNNNTYTGTTSIGNGTLLVTNTPTGSATGTGAVNFNNSSGTVATLASGGGTTGAISGLLTMANTDSTVTPAGAGSVGALTLSGGLTAFNGGTFNFDLGSVANHDLISLVLGTFAGPTAANSALLQMSFTGLAGVTPNTPYTLFTFGGSTNLDAGDFTLFNSPGFSGATFTVLPGQVEVTFAAVPEPGTWIGAALALVAIGFTQRRRLRSLIAHRA